MAINLFSTYLLIFSIIAGVLAVDPDTLQDVCVADTSSGNSNIYIIMIIIIIIWVKLIIFFYIYLSN